MDISNEQIKQRSNAISLRVLSFLAELDEEFNNDPISGALIADALVRLGSSMYFYCSHDKSQAAIAILTATTRGIEEAAEVEEPKNAEENNSTVRTTLQ